MMSERPGPMIYMNYYQQSGPELIVQMKTMGNPADLAQAAEHAIQEVDRGLPVYDVRTMRENTAMASVFVVMQSTFAGIFAVIALVLAATGIYGVMAYRTELRTHEIGIRVALGASPGGLMRLVLLQGMRLTAIGLALGLALSFGLTRVIAGLLYGIGANDPSHDLCRADSARGDVFAGVLSSGTASDAGESGDGDPRARGNVIRAPHLLSAREAQGVNGTRPSVLARNTISGSLPASP